MSWQEGCRRRGGQPTRQPAGQFAGQLACRLPSGTYELAPFSARARDNLEGNRLGLQEIAGDAATVAGAVADPLAKISKLLLVIAAIGVVLVFSSHLRKS